MMEARGEENLPTSELKFIMQRIEQTERDKRALEAKVGAVQRDIGHRRGKDEERIGMVCADMGKQWKTRESEYYCKSNSNARETQAHR